MPTADFGRTVWKMALMMLPAGAAWMLLSLCAPPTWSASPLRGASAKLRVMTANINNLEPGKKWKFTAPILESNATRFEIKDVTGF